MKAVVMAGGEGTRLRPVSGGCPKPMVRLLDKPVLEHTVLLLKKNGFTDICMTLRYKPEQIAGYFGDGRRFGVNISYRIENEPLGTAGGVKNCMDFISGDDFLVISGDAACDFDLRGLYGTHINSPYAVTMALHPCQSPLAYGLVLTDKAGLVRQFIEKPAWGQVITNLVNTGIYMLSPSVMSHVPDGKFFDFAKDLFPILLNSSESIQGAVMDGYWCDIGTPRAYYTCNLDALDGKLRLEHPLEEKGPHAEQEPHTAASANDGSVLICSCLDRARLMRALSENLMEAGADFTDGLSLETDAGRVHIAPSADAQALVIEADAGSEECSQRLAEEYEKLARRLEGDM